MKPKHADDGMKCPHFRTYCVKVCHTCEMWQPFECKDGQTGKDISGWYCSLRMQPQVGLSHIAMTKQTGEVLAATVDKVSAAVNTLQQRVEESHDAAMIGGMHRLNQQLEAAQVALPNGNPQRLIEG